MNIFDQAPQYTFDSRKKAESFCKRVKDIAYKVDVITMNDILLEQHQPMMSNGFQYGYAKKELRKLKPERIGLIWHVVFPSPPSKMVRDVHGYWTTENVLKMEALDKGGGD